MMQLHDLDVQHLKDIPGYKAILKAVIKSQIQQLVEQLEAHTGEESILLTASVSDGTLCNLGTNTGKSFLDGRDEIKSQFLRHCLKRSQRKKQSEVPPEIIEPDPPESYNSRSHAPPEPRTHPPHHHLPHHQRVHPVALTKVTHGASPYADNRGRSGDSQKRSYPTSSPLRPDHSTPSKQGRVSLPVESLPSSYSEMPLLQESPVRTMGRQSGSAQETGVNVQKIDLSGEEMVKLEQHSDADQQDSGLRDDGSNDRVPPIGGHADSSFHSQSISSAAKSSQPNLSQSEQSFNESTSTDQQAAIESEINNLISSIPSEDSSTVDTTNVKIEPITEGEMELEITGVEMAGNSDSFSAENWAANASNRLGYSPTSGMDSQASGSQGGNQSGGAYSQYRVSLSQTMDGLAGEDMLSSDGTLLQSAGSRLQCTYCDKDFLHLSALTRHLRVHTGEKPYQCEYCHRLFKQKVHYEIHKRRHTGEKMYSCKMCEKSYTTVWALDKHFLTKHNK